MKNQIEKRLRERGHSDPSTGVKGIQLEKPRRKKKFWPKTEDEIRDVARKEGWENSVDWPVVDGDIFDPYDIAEGDYVDFGAYGRLFVLKAPMEGSLWVTDKRSDRYDSNAAGWYIRRNQAKKILEEA